jgi:hypothetical protein
MTATRPVPDDTSAADPGVPDGELGGMPPAASCDPVDTVDAQTRHRLRRALRILIAARRRDDGGRRHTDT